MSTFEIIYRVTVHEEEDIDQKVEDICLEQSVEMPQRLLTGEGETKVTGRPTKQTQLEEHIYEVKVAWPLGNIDGDISQFLDILHGNISLQKGIKITGAQWDALYGELFKGPAFGIVDIRKKYGKTKRALNSISLKPLGTNSEEIAEWAYQFAAGGLDLVKDDHNIAHQDYTAFIGHVEACVAAIQRAAEETGHRAYYFAHITALATDCIDRYRKAAELGADGVLICPHIAGMETMHRLARMNLDLPIIAHPAFSGGLTTDEKQGLSPNFLYGQFWRALGADFVVHPNTGGQFSFSLDERQAINEDARTADLPFKPSFPMVGGGRGRSNISHLLDTYGPDTVLLLDADLYEHPDGPRAGAKEISEIFK